LQSAYIRNVRLLTIKKHSQCYTVLLVVKLFINTIIIQKSKYVEMQLHSSRLTSSALNPVAWWWLSF